MIEAAPALMDMRLLAAQAVAREAGAKARRRFLDRSFTVAFKARQDYLTEVDGEVEALVVAPWRASSRMTPSSARENARRAEATASVWVVDPIDGTANFARGIPHFCISIAYLRERKPLIGVIYDPMRDEIVHGRAGAGASTEREPMMRVSDVDIRARDARDRLEQPQRHAGSPQPGR